MKIGDRVYIHGHVDEIRKDTVIIRNEGGYFGTVKSEIVEAQKTEDIVSVIRCKDCKYSDTFSDMTAEPHSQLKCLGIRYGGVEPMWYCEHGKRKEE